MKFLKFEEPYKYYKLWNLSLKVLPLFLKQKGLNNYMLLLECLTHRTMCNANLEELKFNRKLVAPYSLPFYTNKTLQPHRAQEVGKVVHSSCANHNSTIH